MMTIFLESPDTADVRAESVVTVVVVPPEPPEVLIKMPVKFRRPAKGADNRIPPVKSRIADSSNITS